jgi:hypothetical protein
MEEILASIRRIISEDDAPSPSASTTFSSVSHSAPTSLKLEESDREQRFVEGDDGVLVPFEAGGTEDAFEATARSAIADVDVQSTEPIEDLDLSSVPSLLQALNCSGPLEAAIYDNGKGVANTATLLTGILDRALDEDAEPVVRDWRMRFAPPEVSVGFKGLARPREKGRPTRLTNQAQFVFRDAERIRRRTSPHQTLTLRHVLASLLTIDFSGREANWLSEFFSDATGRDPAFLLAEIIREEMPAGDFLDEWREIFVARGAHPPAATALLDADDPWAPHRRDNLGVATEAEAFARTAVAPELLPPFAVGVFGDWGSGKSFFMKLIYEAIARRSQVLANEHGEVVQIRFNAWHYVEGNLWASLVDHLFRDLDIWSRRLGTQGAAEALFGQLSTARRLTLEAAEKLVNERRGQRAARTKSAEADAALAQARASLEQSLEPHLRAVWQKVAETLKADGDRQSKTLVAAAEKVGLPGLIEEGKGVVAEVDRLKAAMKHPSMRALRDPLTLSLVVLAGLVGAVGCHYAGRYLTHYTSQALMLIAQTASLVGPIAVAFAIGRKRLKTAVDVLVAHKDRVAQVLEASLKIDKDAADKAKKQVVTAEADAEAAREAFAIASAKLIEAERAFDMRSPARRLLAFVQERAGSDDYSKHLSLTATIRRDFEELSALLAGEIPQGLADEHAAYAVRIAELIGQQDAGLSEDEIKTLRATVAEASPSRRLHRIVLYIDDLDRCPPERVVEVLQAVHLLLSFKLFVVFVAVDVRWLSRSLESHYGQLLRKQGAAATAATATDYIEKIFQVPFWVQQMEPEGAWRLIEDRIGTLLERQAPRGQAAGPGGGEGEGTDDGAEVKGAKVRTAKQVEGESLEAPLNTFEREYLQSIAGALTHSPRRTLRVINVYRLIKASLPPTQALRLEDLDYQAVLSLLAVSCISEPLFAHLGRVLHRGETPAAFLEAVQHDLDIRLPERRALSVAINALTIEEVDWPRLHALVARFTFQGPDAVWANAGDAVVGAPPDARIDPPRSSAGRSGTEARR